MVADTVKHLIIITALFWFSDAISQVSLTIPVATTHIEYSDFDYNNENRGLGVEYVHDNKHIIGALYLNRDSFNNENVYFYYGRKLHLEKELSFSFSGFFATSYNANTFSPLVSFSYHYLRIVTTYPFGNLVDDGADMVNLQLVIPFNF